MKYGVFQNLKRHIFKPMKRFKLHRTNVCCIIVCMKDIFYELKTLCKYNRDGSFSSQAKRLDDLKLFAHQLTTELNYPRMHAKSLKEKHVKALVEHWQSQGLSLNTIKARMSRLRWWADKVGKPNIISTKNSDYGIGQRSYLSETSKAQGIDIEKTKAIEDPYIAASLLLAREFGLRKEEAIKFVPAYADRGDYIQLKASWCKGGKTRVIPVTTLEQREALDFAKQVAGHHALIPAHLQFHQQRNRYEKATARAGFMRLHALRHRYAQQRYIALTGWLSPHAGGPGRNELSDQQKSTDIEARLIISKELGHERLQITATYIGS